MGRQLVVRTTNAINRRAAAANREPDSLEVRPLRILRWEDLSTEAKLDYLRMQTTRIACSATWAEDWLYRGASYAPDFVCWCETCREHYPQRLYPRPNRETFISIDCQTEVEEDPELREELAKLRNDRPRLGSLFLPATSARYTEAADEIEEMENFIAPDIYQGDKND